MNGRKGIFTVVCDVFFVFKIQFSIGLGSLHLCCYLFCFSVDMLLKYA